MFPSVRLLVIGIILAVSQFPKDAHGWSLCEYYRKHLPNTYKLSCTNGSSSSKPAGATSTFSSAFNLNTASLPTEPSSYGLETLGNFITNPGSTEPFSWTPT